MEGNVRSDELGHRSATHTISGFGLTAWSAGTFTRQHFTYLTNSAPQTWEVDIFWKFWILRQVGSTSNMKGIFPVSSIHFSGVKIKPECQTLWKRADTDVIFHVFAKLDTKKNRNFSKFFSSSKTIHQWRNFGKNVISEGLSHGFTRVKNRPPNWRM